MPAFTAFPGCRAIRLPATGAVFSQAEVAPDFRRPSARLQQHGISMLRRAYRCSLEGTYRPGAGKKRTGCPVPGSRCSPDSISILHPPPCHDGLRSPGRQRGIQRLGLDVGADIEFIVLSTRSHFPMNTNGAVGIVKYILIKSGCCGTSF